MSTTLVSRTISSVVDQRLTLSTAEARRVLAMGTTWNKLRIGMRYSLNGNNAATLGSSKLSIGLCTGLSDGWARTTSVHCVGVRMNSQQLNPIASTPHYYTANIAGAFVAAKRVGTTSTDGSAVSGTAPMFINEITTNRACFFVEITKGSPNFTMQFGAPTAGAAVQTDISAARFAAQMDWPAWSVSGLSTWLAGYNTGSAITLAVNEATDGYLNTLAIHYNIAGSIEISEVAVTRLS